MASRKHFSAWAVRRSIFSDIPHAEPKSEFHQVKKEPLPKSNGPLGG
jgi:hypothetical protein